MMASLVSVQSMRKGDCEVGDGFAEELEQAGHLVQMGPVDEVEVQSFQ